VVDAPVSVRAGDLVSIRFTLGEAIDGFQWTLNTGGLDLAGVPDGEMVGPEHLAVTPNGQVVLSWHRTRWPAPAAEPVSFTLDFMARESGDPLDMLALCDDIAETEAYTEDGAIHRLFLTRTSGGTTDDFAIYQNEPNPWTDNTVIRCHLPEPGPVTLTVYDASGRILSALTEDRPAGLQAWTLTARDIRATGLIYYRIEAGSWSATKKMIRLDE
jgi:hypothetical protein